MTAFALPSAPDARLTVSAVSDLIASQMSQVLRPGDVHELRALGVTLPGRTPRIALSGYFNNVPDMAIAAGKLDGFCKGIYFTLNPLKPGLFQRAPNQLDARARAATNADVQSRQWIPLDFDPQRPAGTSSTHFQLNAAIERADAVWTFLKTKGWPEPLTAVSGNGAHLLFPTNLPVDDGDSLRRAMHSLAASFSDDVVTVDKAVHNPARIWKMYGTLARKGEASPERPHRRALLFRGPQ